MRKSTKIISGLSVAAGLGVVLAPMAALAVSTPTRTDIIRFTNSSACTINGASLDGTTVDLYNYYDGTVTPGNEAVLHIVDGTGEDNPGAATEQSFGITCNLATGYKVVANATNPTGQDTENTGVEIPAGTAISGNNSYWAAKINPDGNLEAVSDDYFAINTANQRVAYNEAGSDADGDTFTVQYKVGAANALKAGDYEGQVVYTVVQGAE